MPKDDHKKQRVLTPPYFAEEGECAPIYCSNTQYENVHNKQEVLTPSYSA